MPSAGNRAGHQRGERVFGLFGRLQETADGKRHLGLAHGDTGLAVDNQGFAIERQAGQTEGAGEEGEFWVRPGAFGADRDVQPHVGDGEGDIARADGCGDIAGDFWRAGQRRNQNRAKIEIVNGVAAQRHEAGSPGRGVERGPATPRAVRYDRVLDLGRNPGALKGLGDQRALEREIKFGRKMLELAAAAGAVMRAWCLPPFRCRGKDIDELPAIALDLGGDRFAGQRQRHEDRLAIKGCDALAPMAKPFDDEGFEGHFGAAIRAVTAPTSGMEGWAPLTRQARPAATPARSMDFARSSPSASPAAR